MIVHVVIVYVWLPWGVVRIVVTGKREKILISTFKGYIPSWSDGLLRQSEDSSGETGSAGSYGSETLFEEMDENET